MTSLESGVLGAVTTLADRQIAVDESVARAVRRDLDRLDLVLTRPVTAVRRDALIGHVQFIVDQLIAHFRAQDEVIWPAAVGARPDLDELATRVRLAHQGIDFAATLRGTDGWTDSAQSRHAVRSAVRHLATAVSPVLEQDLALLPVACATLDETAPSLVMRHAIDLRRAPTRSAKRVFWMLDDLEPDIAERLLRGTPRAAMWVLRNGFSGAYNRGSYLMWTGGGTGPAF